MAGTRLQLIELSSNIAAAGKKAQWQRALAYLYEDGGAPDEVCFHAAANACGRAARWAEALHLVCSSPATSIRGRKEANHCFGLNAVISACGRSMRWSEALALLNPKCGSGLPSPDIVSYNSALAACERASRWAQAATLLRDLQSSAIGVAGGRSLPSPNQITWNTTVSAMARGTRWAEAFRLLVDMPSVSASVELPALNAALFGCSRASLWPLALRTVLVDMTKRWSILPDVVSFSTAMSACCENRQWREAMRIFRRMDRVSCHPDVVACTAAMAACEKAAMWESALEILKWMEVRGQQPNSFSFAAVLGACEGASQWEVASSLLSRMTGANVSPNAACVNAVASAVEFVGHWEMALALVDADASLDIAVRACARKYRWSAIMELLRNRSRRSEFPLGSSTGFVATLVTAVGSCYHMGAAKGPGTAAAQLEFAIAANFHSALIAGPAVCTNQGHASRTGWVEFWRRPADLAVSAALLRKAGLLRKDSAVLFENRVLGPVGSILRDLASSKCSANRAGWQRSSIRKLLQSSMLTGTGDPGIFVREICSNGFSAQRVRWPTQSA